MMRLLAGMLIVVLAGIGRAAAVPPPPGQAAANCDSPTYASDMLVCADPDLLALDRRMRDLLPASAPDPALAPRPLIEGQEKWFRRRSLCAFSERHAACLRAAYEDRMSVLDALRAAGSGRQRPAVSATCRDAPWGTATVRVHVAESGLLTIEDAEAKVLVVATDIAPRDDWSPFVGYVVEGRTIRLAPLERPGFSCDVGNPV